MQQIIIKLKIDLATAIMAGRLSAGTCEYRVDSALLSQLSDAEKCTMLKYCALSNNTIAQGGDRLEVVSDECDVVVAAIKAEHALEQAIAEVKAVSGGEGEGKAEGFISFSYGPKQDNALSDEGKAFLGVAMLNGAQMRELVDWCAICQKQGTTLEIHIFK